MASWFCGATVARRAANTNLRSLFRVGAVFDTRSGTETAYRQGGAAATAHRTVKSLVFFSCCQRALRRSWAESRLLRASIRENPTPQACGALAPGVD